MELLSAEYADVGDVAVDVGLEISRPRDLILRLPVDGATSPSASVLFCDEEASRWLSGPGVERDRSDAKARNVDSTSSAVPVRWRRRESSCSAPPSSIVWRSCQSNVRFAPMRSRDRESTSTKGAQDVLDRAATLWRACSDNRAT